MPRLVVNPGSPREREIQLRPGANSLGRGFSNDFKVDEPSVSTTHCQIIVDNQGVFVKDLGSTNGTYVNRSPVKEALLQAGQTLHLGGVEMLFDPAETQPAPPRAAANGPAIRLNLPGGHSAPPVPPPLVRLAASAPKPEPAIEEPPIEEPPMPSAGPAVATGSQNCKFHPRTAGRYFCVKCALYFCELCVTSRNVGGAPHKYCRRCGGELAPVQLQAQRQAGSRGFFARLPGAFIYPFKGSGTLVLLFATLIFAGLDVMARGGFAILIAMAALGYLFSYMQSIIHCTAAGDDEMASVPGMDGLFGAFFTFAGTVAGCFGLPIGLAIAKYFFDAEISSELLIGTMVLGCLYFPMAFLAVAMKDTLAAANPLVVMPAIIKVPLEYLVTAVLLTGVFGIRLLGNFLSSQAQAVGYHTRDMSVLFMTLGMRALWSLLSIYLLTVGMRILGLLYLTKKEKFGWFSH